MFNPSEYVKIGFVGKPHGVSGETAVRLLPDIESHRLHPSYLFISINGGLVPFRVAAFRYKSEEVLLAKLPLLNDHDKIRALFNCEVYLMPEDVEAMVDAGTGFDSLIGYEVTDETLGHVGKLTGIQDIAGNPLFVVMGNRGEVLIPIVDDFVVKIDEEETQIFLDMPEGLLDINSSE